jgi:hypothetical protein
MRNTRKIVAAVDRAVKENDSAVMVQGTFYDDASDRVFTTLVKGSKRINLTLSGAEAESNSDNVGAKVKNAITKLDEQPIG